MATKTDPNHLDELFDNIYLCKLTVIYFHSGHMCMVHHQSHCIFLCGYEWLWLRIQSYALASVFYLSVLTPKAKQLGGRLVQCDLWALYSLIDQQVFFWWKFRIGCWTETTGGSVLHYSWMLWSCVIDRVLPHIESVSEAFNLMVSQAHDCSLKLFAESTVQVAGKGDLLTLMSFRLRMELSLFFCGTQKCSFEV